MALNSLLETGINKTREKLYLCVNNVTTATALPSQSINTE